MLPRRPIRFLSVIRLCVPHRPVRFLTTLIAIVGCFTTLSILESRLQSYSGGRFSLITAPVPFATPPPPKIVDFWTHFQIIYDWAQPIVQPIRKDTSFDGSNLQELGKAKGDRKPFPKSIGIPQPDVEKLAQGHLRLITHPHVESANERAPDLFNGTGIVTVAGGAHFASTILSIRMLRRTTNSTLPVEVFLRNKAEFEREVCEEVLPSLNAKCFVVEDFLRPSNYLHVSAQQLPILAVLSSSFEKVLFLDSGCMVLRDPMELFNSVPFKTTGLLSWPDYFVATEDPVFYRIAGLPNIPSGVPARASEIGQFMVDKSKHVPSLLLAAYYNIFGPGIYYPILSQGAQGEGNKETLLAAAVVLKKKFYSVAERVGTVGYQAPNGPFHGTAMVQYSAADEWAILHRKVPRNVIGKVMNTITGKLRGNVTGILAGNLTGNFTGNLTASLPTNLTANFTKPLTEAEIEELRPKPCAFFLHPNNPEMSVGYVLDTNAIFLPGMQQRIRLWGPRENMIKMFGYDVEKVAWDEMRHIACDLDSTLEDFKKRLNLCKRANQHYKFYQPDALDVLPSAERKRQKKPPSWLRYHVVKRYFSS